MEHFHRVLFGLGFHLVECAINDALGRGFFSVLHHRIHELRQNDVAEFRVWNNISFFSSVPPGHNLCTSHN